MGCIYSKNSNKSTFYKQCFVACRRKQGGKKKKAGKTSLGLGPKNEHSFPLDWKCPCNL